MTQSPQRPVVDLQQYPEKQAKPITQESKPKVPLHERNIIMEHVELMFRNLL